MKDSNLPSAFDGPSMRFPATSLTLVHRVLSDDPATAHAAWNEFFRAYWYPLYALARGRGANHHDAADLVQGFISTELLGRSLIEQWKAEKGSLRAFLKTVLSRYCVSDYRRESAQKRGGDKTFTHFSMDFEWAEGRYANTAVDWNSPDMLYDKEWAEATLQQAVGVLSNDYASRGKLMEFQLLCCNLTDSSGEGERPLYRDIAAKLGTSEGNVKQKMLVFRQRFRASLTAVVAETVEEADVKAELEYIFMLVVGQY